jgi:G protein-coupled receptor Mth (Methuselah protein)
VDKENGYLQLAPPPIEPLGVEEYCLERVVEHPHRSVSVFICSPPLPDPTWIEDHHNDLRFTLYPAGLAISAFFLAATLATGCLLPKAHHALHWRCQTCHVACLLVGDVLLATVQLSGPALPPQACKIIGKLK